MTDNVPQVYTDRDLAKAKRNAKVVGFIQGGFAVFLVGLVLQFMSWMPFVLGAGVVGYLGYKLLTRGKKGDGEEEEA
jgi:uncharacterized membrane protein